MGLGGYLAARSDAEHFANEKLREEDEVVNVPDVEDREVAEVFQRVRPHRRGEHRAGAEGLPQQPRRPGSIS